MDWTLLIIKPDAVAAGRIGEILAMVTQAGLRPMSMEMRYLAEAEVRAFYRVHQGKPFYEPLMTFMTSGPVVLCALTGDDAVTALRALVGVTDPPHAAPGTVRARFGTTTQKNAVHASDSPENGVAEVSFFFPAACLLPGRLPA
ncbi:MAG: nucleoside-diphosphate kinase [Candidatus Eisenbacteria bacterium]|jgi:nucleoside-diphosphate kinase|nr:nucleoside-diphosphate kinase [Candidatus Eisenbacteria bacterium]